MYSPVCVHVQALVLGHNCIVLSCVHMQALGLGHKCIVLSCVHVQALVLGHSCIVGLGHKCIVLSCVHVQALLEEYTVSGALLLLGAVSLHFCFFGMFFRPTMFERRQAKTVIVVPEQGPQTESDSSKPFLGEICTSSLPLFEDGRLEERGSDDVELSLIHI